MTLKIPPYGGAYFALAEAVWAKRYTRREPPDDRWYVVRVRANTDTKKHMVFVSDDKSIIARFRHHGVERRLFVLEEAIQVVNQLNEMILGTLAVSQEVGGLTKLVHRVSRELAGEDENAQEG